MTLCPGWIRRRPSRHPLVPIPADRRRSTTAAAPRGRVLPHREPFDRRSLRSPVICTSARTHRGSGSSTGASPAHAKRRMLSTGRTATGRGSALIIAAAVAHPGGYCTAEILPPTPQARSGSVATHRGAADQRRRGGRKPASQRDHRRGTGQRVAGHCQRHPFLRVAHHAETGQRANRRLHECDTRTGGHRRGQHHRNRRKDKQRHCRWTTQHHRQSDSHDADQYDRCHHRESRCPRGGYGLGIPNSAEAGQAGQGAEARLGACRERLHTVSLR